MPQEKEDRFVVDFEIEKGAEGRLESSVFRKVSVLKYDAKLRQHVAAEFQCGTSRTGLNVLAR